MLHRREIILYILAVALLVAGYFYVSTKQPGKQQATVKGKLK